MSITLYQFPAMLGVPNMSPFCMKVEVFLRLAGLDYEVQTLTSPRQSPSGKLPYIRDGARVVTDSHSIVEYLTDTYRLTLDAWLTPQQKAVARAFERMLSEHTYWGLIHARWIDDAGWAILRPLFFGRLPLLLRSIVPPLVRRAMAARLHAHGLGRHTAKEIRHRIGLDLQALADQLGNGPYFMGERPSSIDASVYAMLANYWDAELDSPYKSVIAALPALPAYCVHMRHLCYPA